MRNQDYKLKYNDLKLKFHDAVDVAFRLGMEQGLQQAQVQQAQQDKADAQAQQAAAMGQPGQPGEDPNAAMQPGMDQQSDGSELDQHIGQLEGMLQKTDAGTPEFMELKKSLDGIKAFQFGLKQKHDLRKAEQTIKAIGKAMKSPFTMSKRATKNMSEHGKKALNDQEKIVDELMKSFADEEAKATQAIAKTLDFEQILKG